MKINHTVVNMIKTVKYSYYFEESYYVFNDPMDLKSRSHNLGLVVEPMWKLVQKSNSSGLIGINSTFYFVEIFNSKFVTIDEIVLSNEDLNESIQTFAIGNNDFISASSSSLELFYLHNFNLKPNFNLGVRASVGTNFYSNWDQFKRYVWAGVGLEMSFGRNKK